MEIPNPSMRLKVKSDTFFLPAANGSVYFRNNEGSAKLEGSTVQQWIEKLLPVFDGSNTLGELTDELPEEYVAHVYEIASFLYKNGFVRDVSHDLPHQLPDQVLQKHAAQIEFLDSRGGSGAYRFQSYRQASVLAVGSGPFLIALVSALLDSGLQNIQMLITDAVPTHRKRLFELVAHAQKTDPDVTVREVAETKKDSFSWQETVQPFDWILYVAEEANLDEIRSLESACLEQKKRLLPAVCVEQVGLAGPLIQPSDAESWESVWRRLHQVTISKDPQWHTLSTTSMALLSNLLVFALVLAVAGIDEANLKNRFFLLNLETLEGNWHSFLPHPLVTALAKIEPIEQPDLLPEQNSRLPHPNRLLENFHWLTSPVAGIFHSWEEGELKQLPLAQCCVQVTDPVAHGPAALLTPIVCTGKTHAEARREAGLAGMEAYVSRLLEKTTTIPSVKEGEYVGIGAGGSLAEGVCRGLQKCLVGQLRQQLAQQIPSILPIQLDSVADEHCQFYLKALTAWQTAPVLGLGKEICGFPVVWVGIDGSWIGRVDLHVTMALRNGLRHALMKKMSHGQAANFSEPILEVPTVNVVDAASQNLVIQSFDDKLQAAVLPTALQVLQQNGKRCCLFDLSLEPFLKEELAGVYGVLLREEEAQ